MPKILQQAIRPKKFFITYVFRENRAICYPLKQPYLLQTAAVFQYVLPSFPLKRVATFRNKENVVLKAHMALVEWSQWQVKSLQQNALFLRGSW